MWENINLQIISRVFFSQSPLVNKPVTSLHDQCNHRHHLLLHQRLDSLDKSPSILVEQCRRTPAASPCNHLCQHPHYHPTNQSHHWPLQTVFPYHHRSTLLPISLHPPIDSSNYTPHSPMHSLLAQSPPFVHPHPQTPLLLSTFHQFPLDLAFPYPQ